MLLVCVESHKMTRLCKLKQLYKWLPVGFLISTYYIFCHDKLYTEMT